MGAWLKTSNLGGVPLLRVLLIYGSVSEEGRQTASAVEVWVRDVKRLELRRFPPCLAAWGFGMLGSTISCRHVVEVAALEGAVVQADCDGKVNV